MLGIKLTHLTLNGLGLIKWISQSRESESQRYVPKSAQLVYFLILKNKKRLEEHLLQ